MYLALGRSCDTRERGLGGGEHTALIYHTLLMYGLGWTSLVGWEVSVFEGIELTLEQRDLGVEGLGWWTFVRAERLTRAMQRVGWVYG